MLNVRPEPCRRTSNNHKAYNKTKLHVIHKKWSLGLGVSRVTLPLTAQIPPRFLKDFHDFFRISKIPKDFHRFQGTSGAKFFFIVTQTHRRFERNQRAFLDLKETQGFSSIWRKLKDFPQFEGNSRIFLDLKEIQGFSLIWKKWSDLANFRKH